MLKQLFFAAIAFLSGCDFKENPQPKKKHTPKVITVRAAKQATGIDGPLSTDSLVLQQKIKAVYNKAKVEKYNSQYALLADLGLHSGSKRIFLIDLPHKKILTAGLVTHGSSTTYLQNGKRQYSNTNGSLCSSLGMYKIGGHYQGQFGLAYKLYGLGKENSNAYARAIVLHSHSCVPNEETANPICQSWGCPTVSPSFLQMLSNYIDPSDKAMLLYLFDSTR